MSFSPDLLFVYGSLLDSTNEFGSYLQSNSVFIGKGKLRGRLYNLGSYPGAIADPTSGSFISGSLVRIKKPSKTLKVIDDYEGFGDKQEQPNLFIRSVQTIETENGPLRCWVYLYNLPVEGYEQIISGVYQV